MRLILLFIFTMFFATNELAAQEMSTMAPSREEIVKARDQLRSMTGDWMLAFKMTEDDGATWTELKPSAATVTTILGGKMVRENVVLDFGNGYQMVGDVTISYDPFRGVYRASWSDSSVGLLDVYEGKMIDGKIVMDNLRAGTTWNAANGSRLNFRISWGFESEQERSYVIEMSDDLGKTWHAYYDGMFTRSK